MTALTCEWCANFLGKKGPVEGIATDPIYIDVSVSLVDERPFPWRPLATLSPMFFAEAESSAMRLAHSRCNRKPFKWADTNTTRGSRQPLFILFDRGDEVTVQAGGDGIRFLLVSGKPLQEPVAWYGPIVMNHTGTTPPGLRRTGAGKIPKATLIGVLPFSDPLSGFGHRGLSRQ